MYKDVGGEWVEVEVELVSKNPQIIIIEGGMTTQAVLRFDAEQVHIDFQEGDLNIEIEIDDTSTEVDEDQDGFTVKDGDCNDQDATINPDSMDVCDGLDNNCDGEIDENAEDEIINDGIDQDCDGEDLVLSCEVEMTGFAMEFQMVAQIHWQVLWYANEELILDTENYSDISNEIYMEFEYGPFYDYEVLTGESGVYAAFYDSSVSNRFWVSAGTHPNINDPTNGRVVSCFAGITL